MNIYRAKRIVESSEFVEGQLIIQDDKHYILVQEEDFMGYYEVEIDPSALEKVKLDLNDEQRHSLLCAALDYLHKTINRLERMQDAEFSLQMLEGFAHLNLDALKRVNQCLEGI